MHKLLLQILRRLFKLEDKFMSFQEDLLVIKTRLAEQTAAVQKASDDAAAAVVEADAAAADATSARAKAEAAAAQDVAQDAAIVAADAKAQLALDELAQLTTALANNPTPPVP